MRSCHYFDLPWYPCTSPLWIALLDFSVWTCRFPLFKSRSVPFGIQPLSWVRCSASWGPQLAPTVFAFHQQGMPVWRTRPRFVFFLRLEFPQKTASLHRFLVLRKIELSETDKFIILQWTPYFNWSIYDSEAGFLHNGHSSFDEKALWILSRG